MSNIDKLASNARDRVEAALKAAEAKIETAIGAKAEPAIEVPNDFVDSISVIEVKLPQPQQGTVEGEIIGLSKREAETLDKELVAAVDTVGISMERLYDLVEQAKAGQIHATLGFPSWTAYFASRVTVPLQSRGERKSLAIMLHNEGLSNRSIAKVLGVSHGTVVTDVKKARAEAEANGAAPQPKSGTTIGKDGKEYKRKPTPKPEPKPEPKKTLLEVRVDIAVADSENVVADLTALIKNLETLYGTPEYVAGTDKAIQAQIKEARALFAKLPKAPTRRKPLAAK